MAIRQTVAYMLCHEGLPSFHHFTVPLAQIALRSVPAGLGQTTRDPHKSSKPLHTLSMSLHRLRIDCVPKHPGLQPLTHVQYSSAGGPVFRMCRPTNGRIRGLATHLMPAISSAAASEPWRVAERHRLPCNEEKTRAGTEEATQRYRALRADFTARYGVSPTLFARAPGRVNIIGEHIDYEGYGVLPMAITRDTVVAIALTGSMLDVSNHDQAAYPAYTFVPDPSQLVDTDNHVWANYALAAYKGVHEYLQNHPAAHTALSKSNPGIKVCGLVSSRCCSPLSQSPEPGPMHLAHALARCGARSYMRRKTTPTISVFSRTFVL
jgi:hypothetical protein